MGFGIIHTPYYTNSDTNGTEIAAGQKKKKIPSSLEEKFHSYDYEATTGENKTDPAKSSTMTKYSCHPP